MRWETWWQIRSSLKPSSSSLPTHPCRLPRRRPWMPLNRFTDPQKPPPCWPHSRIGAFFLKFQKRQSFCQSWERECFSRSCLFCYNYGSTRNLHWIFCFKSSGSSLKLICSAHRVLLRWACCITKWSGPM